MHTIKDNLPHHLNQFLYVKSMGAGEALTFLSPSILGEVIYKNFHLPLPGKAWGFNQGRFRKYFVFSPTEKYCNKAFIICTELCMLPYQSKLSITAVGPSCYLLLFKSENNKRVTLAQASNLPAKLGT